METILMALIAYAVGYWLGKRVGVAQTMLRVRKMLYDFEIFDYMFYEKKKPWSEDNF